MDVRASTPSASDLAVIVDGWNFTGEDAEKTIETACLGNGAETLSGFPGMPVRNVMCEKTVLKFKKKR